MNIRKYDTGDLTACLDIYNYYISATRYTLEETPLSAEEFKARIEKITATYPFIVAEENGAVIGYAYLNVFNERSAYRITADLSVYVDKDSRKSGAGTALLTEILSEAKTRGIKNVVSLITADNAASEKFHLKNGFTLCGTLTDVAVKFGVKTGVKFFIKRV